MFTSFEYLTRSGLNCTGSHHRELIDYMQIRNYLVNLETCNVHKLLQLCEVGNYHLFVISSANNMKIACFTVKQPYK